MSHSYSISELAQAFDITTRSIRFYEEKGLLKPKRHGTNRIYSESDKVKLKLILRGKRLGFSLVESKDIIDMYQPKQNNDRQIKTLLNKIHQKRSQLQQQLKDISVMLIDLDEAEDQCKKSLAQTEQG